MRAAASVTTSTYFCSLKGPRSTYERRVAPILLQIYTYYHYEHKERLHLWMKYTLHNVPVVLSPSIVHARTFLSGHSASKTALFAALKLDLASSALAGHRLSSFDRILRAIS